MPDLLTNATRFASHLRRVGLLPDPALSWAGVMGDIHLDGEGRWLGYSLRSKDKSRTLLPALPPRTSQVEAAFLSGSRDYWLGASGRAAACRAAQAELHAQVLNGVRHPVAKGLLAFLAAEPPDVTLPKILGFWAVIVDGVAVHEVPEILDAWRRHYTPPETLNPFVRISSTSAMSRLVSTNMPAALGYEQVEVVAPPGVTGDYGAALNWLMARPSTLRIGETAFFGWVEGQPEIDPTEDLLSKPVFGGAVARPWPTSYPAPVHFAALTLHPPARVSVRYYFAGDGDDTAARIRSFRERMTAAAGGETDYHNVHSWHLALYGSPRQESLMTEIIQAALCGYPMPRGVLAEMVRLMRRDRKYLPMRVALISLCLEA